MNGNHVLALCKILLRNSSLQLKHACSYGLEMAQLGCPEELQVPSWAEAEAPVNVKPKKVSKPRSTKPSQKAQGIQRRPRPGALRPKRAPKKPINIVYLMGFLKA